jgi:hypothetical protein
MTLNAFAKSLENAERIVRNVGRKGATILNLRVNKRYPDVTCAYYEETVRRLTDMASLARGGDFAGPYFTQPELFGRVQYVCWVNSNRRRLLLPKWNALDWDAIQAEAAKRGLLRQKRISIRRKAVRRRY